MQPHRSLLVRFVIRWFASTLGLWLAAVLWSSHISFSDSFWAIVGAGFLLALLNMLLKPLLIFLSLPALILSLGLFMFVVNGFVVWLVSVLYTPLHITSFWAAVFAGIVIGLVNILVTAVLEREERR